MYNLTNYKLLILYKNEFEQIILFCNDNEIKFEYFIKKLFNLIYFFNIHFGNKYIIISYDSNLDYNLLSISEDSLISYIEQIILLSNYQNIEIDNINKFIELNNYEINNNIYQQDIYLMDVERYSNSSNECVCSESDIIEETDLLIDDLNNMNI